MAETDKPRLVGLNHIALEVGDIEAALAFYGKIFSFELRGRGEGHAFIDMGDQFIALMETTTSHADRERHFGLVVDDRSQVRDWRELRVPSCTKETSSTFSIPGETESRWLSIAMFSSAKRSASCGE